MTPRGAAPRRGPDEEVVSPADAAGEAPGAGSKERLHMLSFPPPGGASLQRPRVPGSAGGGGGQSAAAEELQISLDKLAADYYIWGYGRAQPQ